MAKNKLILGIDVGGTYFKYGLVNSQGKITNFQQTATPKSKREIINLLIKIISLYHHQISKIGIGFPGQVDIKTGRVINVSNLPLSLANTPLIKLIKQKINLPIKIDNDARCFALAEAVRGAGKNYQVVIGITIGTGVGSGIVINKKLFYGRGNAGEFGHQFIDYRKAKNLEDYSGAGRLRLTPADYQGLEKLARQKNQVASKFWHNLGLVLGFGCLNLIHFFDPDIIVMGGKQTRAFKLFYPVMMKTIKKYCRTRPPKIIKSTMIDKAGVIGATLLFKS